MTGLEPVTSARDGDGALPTELHLRIKAPLSQQRRLALRPQDIVRDRLRFLLSQA